MATPGQLVNVMADVLGIGRATVSQYDRVLAEGGLRSTGGRGRSAAKVTPLDAVTLLIAILGSPVSGGAIKDAAKTFRIYGSLPHLFKAAVGHELLPRFGLKRMGALPREHSLVTALTTLIEGAMSEQFQIPIKGEDPLVGTTADFQFSIQFDGPRPWVCLFADRSLGKGHRNTSRFVYTNFGSKSRGDTTSRLDHDLHQRRYISFRTIRHIATTLEGSKP